MAYFAKWQIGIRVLNRGSEIPTAVHLYFILMNAYYLVYFRLLCVSYECNQVAVRGSAWWKGEISSLLSMIL